MNWILGTFYLCVLFIVYYILGYFVTSSILKKDYDGFRIVILGFFSLHFICFLTGELGIILKFSWNSYFLVTTTFCLVCIFFTFFKEKDSLIGLLKSAKFKKIKEHIKNYWFLYSLVLIFTILSICNSNAYYQMNYDDGYYIGKVANLIESPQLLNEWYFLGNVIDAPIGLERLINTYEITEAFLSYLFHLTPAFFCRFVMVVNNYLIIFFTYIEFAKEFVSSKNIQFVLLPFLLLLIPHSYLAYGSPIKIKFYDGWQFQTAIFYGGSIVRSIMIPIILIYGKELIKKFSIKDFLLVAVLCLVFVSFSTIALQISLLLVLCLIIIYVYRLIAWLLSKKIESKKLRITLALMITAVFFGTIFFLLEQFYSDNLTSAIDEYLWYYEDYVENNLVFTVGYIVFILMFLIFKGFNRFYIVILFGFYTLFRTNFFLNLIVLTSFSFFFVSMRTITSISMLILLFIGILIIYLFQKIHVSYKLLSLLSCLVFFAVGIFTYSKMDIITYYTYGVPSGMAKSGYTLNPLLDNDQLLPEEIAEIGDYFNSLPYGNYRIMLPIEFENYKDIGKLTMTSLYSASNRVEFLYSHADINKNITKEDIYSIIDFYNYGVKDYQRIEKIMDKTNTSYILVFDKDDENYFDNHSFSRVQTSSTDFYYALLVRDGE